MTELSSMGKIKQALDLAVKAETGCALTHFEAIELLGHIKALEEDYYLTNETIKQDGNLGISFNELMEKCMEWMERADGYLARAEAAENVIRGMFPMWIAAMSYGEHGRAADLDRIRNYYNGRDNPMTSDDIHLMFSLIPDKDGE